MAGKKESSMQWPHNMSAISRFFLTAIATATVLVSGCTSVPPSYEDALNASDAVKANSAIIPASLNTTWSHVLLVLPQDGFIVQNIDDKNRVISAHREITDTHDPDTSYEITTSITLVPAAADKTEVVMAANRKTEVHHQDHTWWHLLWLIPIFPTGTEYTTVVTARDTIHSPHFYDAFFVSLKSSIQAASVHSAPVVHTAPAPMPVPAVPLGPKTAAPEPKS